VFLRGQGRYGFGNAAEDITNVYICWALTESGAKGDSLSNEINNLLNKVKTKEKDPYYMALLASVLFNIKHPESHTIAKKLVELQDVKTGCVGNSSSFTSITYSYGDGLKIEATGLAAYAWMKSEKEYIEPIEKAMKWIYGKCKDGAFGATQSTIVALKSIIRYDQLRAITKPGVIHVLINGTEISAVKVDSTSAASGKIEVDLQKYLNKSDKYVVALKADGGLQLTYSICINYNAITPDNSENCEVDLKTKLNDTEITEGDTTEIEVTMKNLSTNSGQPMTIAVIGLPGGLEPRHEQLHELVKSGKIDFYEILGRRLAVYLREMDKGQEVKFRVDVTAKFAGTYSGPASTIYRYYTNEHKRWNAPLKVNITPRV